MLQIFVMHNPIMSKGLSITQKLCYFNSCLFWFFSFSRIVFFIAPAMFLVIGLRVYYATLPEILAYAIPHLFSVYVIMYFFYGKYRLPFVSEIYESVQSIFLFPAVVSVLMHPRRPKFQITPKGKKLESTHLNSMASTFFVVVLANMAALPFAAYRWLENPLYRDVIILATSWCIYNIVVSVSSLGAFWEKKQIRRTHRIDASGPVTVNFLQYNTTVTGSMKDISLTGMGAELELPFKASKRDRVMLSCSDSYGNSFAFEATLFKLVPLGGNRYSCGFDFAAAQKDYENIVRFMYGDSQKWLDIWDKRFRPSRTPNMMVHFLRLGIRASRECAVSMYTSAFNYIKTRILPKEIELVERSIRQEAAATIEVHFPQYRHTASGDLKDVSMTGMGVELDIPFVPGTRDAVVLMCSDEHGTAYSFEAKLYRIRPLKGEKFSCGFGFDNPEDIAEEVFRFSQGVRPKKIRFWEAESMPKGLLPGAGYLIIKGFRAVLRGITPASSQAG
jgi:hypothetical protein